MNQPLRIAEPPERTLPVNLTAEMSVIGSVFCEPACLDNIIEFLPTADGFTDARVATVYQVMLNLHKLGTGIDGVTLWNHIRANRWEEQSGGKEFCTEMANVAPTAAHAEYYAAIVQDLHNKRRVLAECNRTVNEVYDSGEPSHKIIERHEGRFFALSERRDESSAVLVSQEIHAVVEAMCDPSRARGTMTGLTELDGLTNGLLGGQYIIVAARPSHGKTALGTTITEYINLDLHQPTAIFSLEMSREQIMKRMMCSRARVDSHKVSSGRLSADESRRLGMAVGQFANGKPLIIDDTPGITASAFRAKARRMVKRHGVKFILLDYIQLMTGPGNSRQEVVSEISRTIKATARELNVPILALAQLNREVEGQDRLPRPSDIRESGSLEQDADAVLLLYQEAVAKRNDVDWLNDANNHDKLTTAMLVIAKQRNGPCETIRLRFAAGQTRFSDYFPPDM